MMDNVLDELPSFVRKVISSNRANFSQKSSTYNNLVAMAATVKFVEVSEMKIHIALISVFLVWRQEHVQKASMLSLGW
jgi:hypothetical protein